MNDSDDFYTFIAIWTITLVILLSLFNTHTTLPKFSR